MNELSFFFKIFRHRYLNKYLLKNRQKIFCIGKNKTGTTSLRQAFLEFGLVVGYQRDAEKLLKSYINNDFNEIIKYCKTAQAFQDIPFSLPKTYKVLDSEFPDAKFILTIRDNPDQWYSSAIRFYTKKFGSGNIPTKTDLQNAEYVYKGWMWEENRETYDTSENDIYNKELMVKQYISYNAEVISYFSDRPDKLLIINVSEKNSYQKLAKFLNVQTDKVNFPWKNKTDE
ncbi:hypothetical protein G3I01_11045 [Gramella sp. MT6]|uniref:sulfotransferase n=1 Tax=Gramella sp. MT6 TaxID=2705471 RepID=UPI001C5F1389|nr:sulfotransferase [Gramella sp. MT6]QYA26029.1 hypothetical protein G3I01_11045 [Gramella sp. MT6]